MADLETYCDSEEEVFFGPISEKERQISDRLRRRAIVPHELKASLDALNKNSLDGEEGLHALAMAAQMLSVSSSEEEACAKEDFLLQEIKQEEVACCNISSSTASCEVDNVNEGSHLELDAVKFLSQRFPEQENHSGFFTDPSKSSDKTSLCSGSIHHTSFASVENNPENAYFLDNDIDVDLLPDSLTAMEADCKIENLRMDGTTHLNLDILNINNDLVKIEKTDKLHPISETDQLTTLKLSSMDWGNANDRSDFGMKTSDNEEEMEKVERNLKVEEIIKFLADEEVKTELEGEKENCLESFPENKSSPKSSLQENVLNMTNKHELISEINEKDALEMDDCKDVVDVADLNKNPCKKSEIGLLPEESNQFEISDCGSTDMDIKLGKDHISDKPIMKEFISEINEKDAREMDDCKDVVDVTDLNINPCKESEIGLLLEESNQFEISDCGSTDMDVKLGKDHISDKPTKKEFIEKLDITSMTTSMEDQKAKKLRTPSKILPKQPPSRTNLIKNFQPHQYSSSPMAGISGKRHPGTPRPLKSPTPTRVAMPSGLPVSQSASSTTSCHFKTPNSKSKTLLASKIPHLSSPVTPSPRKNKFVGIVSPVAQYIHGNPVLLIANKKPVGGYNAVPHSKLLNSNNGKAIEKPVPHMLAERGAENVDVNNVPSASLPANVNYKSALPIKIFSPSPSKCPNNGPTVTVSKHLGRVNITSLKSGDAGFQLLPCRESMMPDGEVSILVSKEMGLTNPTSP